MNKHTNQEESVIPRQVLPVKNIDAMLESAWLLTLNNLWPHMEEARHHEMFLNNLTQLIYLWLDAVILVIRIFLKTSSTLFVYLKAFFAAQPTKKKLSDLQLLELWKIRHHFDNELKTQKLKLMDK